MTSAPSAPVRWVKHRPSPQPKPPRAKLTPGMPVENSAEFRRACDRFFVSRGINPASATGTAFLFQP